jgi:hypothetical protein
MAAEGPAGDIFGVGCKGGLYLGTAAAEGKVDCRPNRAEGATEGGIGSTGGAEEAAVEEGAKRGYSAEKPPAEEGAAALAETVAGGTAATGVCTEVGEGTGVT